MSTKTHTGKTHTHVYVPLFDSAAHSMNFNTNHYVPQYPQLKFQGRGCPQQSQYGRGLVRGGCYGGRHQCFGAAREQSFATATATSSRLPAGAAQPLGCLQGTTGDAPSAQLFISNIPSRVREEEIVRLFRPFPGFLSGRLRRTKMNNYIAFVEFDSAEHSGHARDILNGYNFDTKTVPPNNTAYTRQELKYFGITIDFSRPQQQQQQQQQQHFQLYHFPPAARQPPQQQLPPSLQPSLLTVDTGYDGNSSINGSNVYDENNNDDDDDDDEDNVVSNNDNNGGTFQSHFILCKISIHT